MSNRIRIYHFHPQQLAVMITSQRNPDPETWPDDAVVEDVWIDRQYGPTRVSFKVSHPSFAEVVEGGMAPGFLCGLVKRESPAG